jgi:hypothetical protein
LIHIIQCLCGPERHAILATAYDPNLIAPEKAMQDFKELVSMAAQSWINQFCGLCGSRAWVYEDGVTRYATVEEALPPLKQNERDQLETAAYLRASKN